MQEKADKHRALIEKSVSEAPHCPHCKSETVACNGTAAGLQRFKCRDCAKTFNALTGTPLARLRMKGKWVNQAEALCEGLTLKEAAECINVSHPAAFRWRHIFLALPKTMMAQALVGIVESGCSSSLQFRLAGQKARMLPHPAHEPALLKNKSLRAPCAYPRSLLRG